jgi:hypothetical protein
VAVYYVKSIVVYMLFVVQDETESGNVMNRQNVTKWCCEFSEGSTDVHDEQRNGRPSLISDNLLQEIEREIHAN